MPPATPRKAFGQIPARLLTAMLVTAALLAAPAVQASPAAPGSSLGEMINLHGSAQGDSPVRDTAPFDAQLTGSSPSNAPAARLAAAPDTRSDCPALLRHAFTPIQGGTAESMCQYQGKVLLVVNTASECGYTYQYEGLEALYSRYRARGLVVVGFPSNDFGGQEPGSNKDIAEFCRTVYGVRFPMFEKQGTGKLATNPLYAALMAATGQSPRWNFHKYLVDRSGARVQSFASAVEPGGRELTSAIERWLAEKPQAASVN